MSIKCTEATEAASSALRVVQAAKHNNKFFKLPHLHRNMQLRKRSLTSMGWRYHV